jgi:hypothetical protein|tara:strand:- start:771 stop:974 length:204 start_codon:yes stop_codon:yes gene_type:complete
MAPKLKPSTKEYERDSRGRMTQRWKWKHYTVSSTSTAELEKLLVSPSMTRKKNVIQRELEKRKLWQH